MASAGGAFGGSRGLQPLPPEKGVFPLDHFGECKQVGWDLQIHKEHLQSSCEHLVIARPYREIRDRYGTHIYNAWYMYQNLQEFFLQIMTEYMKCLKENGSKGEKCRDITKSYLECRMDRNLMAKQELRELGFSGRNEPPGPRSTESPTPRSVPQSQKGATGYVAGLPSNNPAK